MTKAFETTGCSRLALLTREDLSFKLELDRMNEEVTSIWVKIGSGARDAVLVGGMYREHTVLRHDDPAASRELRAQVIRWKKFVTQWISAADTRHCIVLGDLNLDKLNWEDPDPIHRDMIEMIKMEIEPRHFSQHIVGPTRFWPGTTSTLLDHIWPNNPLKIISTRNITRGAGDHNLIHVKIRRKGQDNSAQEVLGRDRRKFSIKNYRENLKNQNWNDILETDNLDLAYSKLEEIITKILDEAAPMRKTQPRKKRSDWISEETKDLMKHRDNLRNVAVGSSHPEDWMAYKACRNKCTSQVKSERNSHLKTLHEVIAET